MERSGNFNFYLPSRDTDDIADINQISENFKVIDEKLFETSEVANSLRKDADEGKFKGEKGDKGDDYVLTEADKTEIADIVLEVLPNGDEVHY